MTNKKESPKLGRGKYKRTKATLLKLSKSLIGKLKTKEVKDKMRGRKVKPETIEKMKKAKLGKKRPPRSIAWKKKQIEGINKFWNDPEKSVNARKKISVKASIRMKGKKYALGCKRSDAFKKNISNRMIEMYKNNPEKKKIITQNLMRFLKNNPDFILGEHIKGEKNPNWAGGVTPYNANWSKTTRPKILERDNYTCQNCFKKGSKNIQLDVHHINGNTHDDKEDNLITLCRKCHLSLEKTILKGFLELIEEMYMAQFNQEMPTSKKEKVRQLSTTKRFELNRIKK